jgi:hypothetical protein
MRRFNCARCGAEVFFDSMICEICHSSLIFDPHSVSLLAVDSAAVGPPYVCANRDLINCNWASDGIESLCSSCRHTMMVPNLDHPSNRERWARLEAAKRLVVSALDQLGLSHPTKRENADSGLAFHFLADDPNLGDPNSRVMTGHENGLIVVNIAEADDAIREQRRAALNEPYRTLVGHIRHEIGHYYWDRLIRYEGGLRGFRALFGDEREDYAQSLQRYYNNGPRADWQAHFVSAYASCHPWEDFAETWAHYMHTIDGLQTAIAFGLATPPSDAHAEDLSAFPYLASLPFNRIAVMWSEVAIAVNALNRSLGQPDLYPFVLSNEAIEKLDFVHQLIVSQCGHERAAA